MSDSARREGRENYVECCAEESLIKLTVMVMVEGVRGLKKSLFR